MEKFGYNPKTTQQAIDAMYMSSEEFYKAYEAYINRKADWYISAEEAIRLKIADAYYK